MSTEHLTRQSSCRICGHSDLNSVLDLGEVPPANGFVDDPQDDEKFFPLQVVFCRKCSHVQLQHTVSRSFLFDEYPYFASSSGSISEHFQSYAAMLEQRHLDSGDFAVDIGSNDGGLLAALSDNIDRLGVEPAENVAAVARERGVPTMTEYFDPKTASDIRESSGPADVICANNVVAHIADLHKFFDGVNELLAPEGVFVMEVPYLLDLVSESQFSTIYHEHLSYFSIASLSTLVEAHDMFIAAVERLDRHGGSIRAHIQKRGTDAPRQFQQQVRDLRRLERAHGLSDPSTLDQFADRVRRKRDAIRSLISDIAETDVTIVGYGASAKGNVILNYCDIGPDQIDYLVDEMEAKQRMYSPGQGIPIRSPEVFRADPPEYALLLAWNYWGLVREKESAFLDQGGTFVLPSPYVDVRSNSAG